MTKVATRAILLLVKKQADFFQMNRDFAPNRITHGDASCVGKRKIARPFKRNTPIHLILKSANAKGDLNLRTAVNRIAVDQILERQARKFQIKVHAEQNVGNHIHCIVSSGSRQGFQNFLRAVTGLIAKAVVKTGKFWTQPPFTRLITGRRDLLSMLNYVAKNLIEATFGKAARKQVEVAEMQARKERAKLQRRSRAKRE